MYLTKQTYVGANYDHNKITGEIELYKDGKLIDVNLSRVTNINERVGYWRKANHIHKWFVDNCQNGVDDCKEYYVSIEQLKELLQRCKDVLQDIDLAVTLLPTTSGFYFGSDAYGESYIDDTKATIKIIEDILAEDIDGRYYYRSSW